MNMFDVYPLYELSPVRAEGAVVWDDKGGAYLDFYGGHGVISVGHSHPDYVAAVTKQLQQIGFYSNAVDNPLQRKLAQKLGAVSGCESYNLFLCNSGAEANENALKLASFETTKKRVIAFHNSFHGRTSAAVAVTDNKAINAPINLQQAVCFLPLNDAEAVRREVAKGDIAALIIEGIQGVGGLDQGSTEFFKEIEKICRENGVLLILDEIQSGYGRTGKFFAFQHHGIQPDIITVAKGMGNGFPIAGVLISEHIKARHGRLGTTFGGNHLACAAAISVLDIMVAEKLLQHTEEMHQYLIERLRTLPKVQEVKGRGLMLGLSFDFEVANLRKTLLFDHCIFTGGSIDKKLLRILPPLNIQPAQIDQFIGALQQLLNA